MRLLQLEWVLLNNAASKAWPALPLPPHFPDPLSALHKAPHHQKALEREKPSFFTTWAPCSSTREKAGSRVSSVYSKERDSAVWFKLSQSSSCLFQHELKPLDKRDSLLWSSLLHLTTEIKAACPQPGKWQQTGSATSKLATWKLHHLRRLSSPGTEEHHPSLHSWVSHQKIRVLLLYANTFFSYLYFFYSVLVQLVTSLP